jgi:hypothetical protein
MDHHKNDRLAIKWKNDWHICHDLEIKYFSQNSSPIHFDAAETTTNSSSNFHYPLSQLSLDSNDEQEEEHQSCESIENNGQMKRDLSSYSICNESKKKKEIVADDSDYDDLIEEIMSAYDQF